MNSSSFSLHHCSTATDFQLIQELAYEIWPVHYSSIISVEQIEYMLRELYSESALRRQQKDGQLFYLAIENQVPVGFLGISNQPNKELKINKLYLLESCRGKGFGKEMIAFAQLEAGKTGAKKLILNVNRFNGSLDFYKAIGFSVRETIDIPFGPFWLNDFIMEKEILTN